MRAIVTLWRHVAEGLDLPALLDCETSLGATLTEMQAEAKNARDRLRQIAKERPDDRDAGSAAEFGEAVWWHLQPIASGSLPHIWVAHEYAQHLRARSR